MVALVLELSLPANSKVAKDANSPVETSDTEALSFWCQLQLSGLSNISCRISHSECGSWR